MDWIPKSKSLYGGLNAVKFSRLERNCARIIGGSWRRTVAIAKPNYEKPTSMSSVALALIKDERERRQHRHHQIKCNTCRLRPQWIVQLRINIKQLHCQLPHLENRTCPAEKPPDSAGNRNRNNEHIIV
uniref:Uncharacterized protein n=1 Tax=Caenorhabditis japonica TaxID=281687 RepID=A0A8R1EUM1_CAEJA